MKKLQNFFVAATLLLGGHVALAGGAGAPHPTAVDSDRDGSFVPTFDVNGDGSIDAKDIGVLAIDCDDTHASMTPGKQEIPDDGIDQDCSGADLSLPVTDAEWKRYVAKEYGGKAPNPVVFSLEYDNCKAATGRCEVDSIDGVFRVTDPTHTFADIHVNGTDVLRNHGQKPDGREVVTCVQASHYNGYTSCTGSKAKAKSAGSGSGTGSGSGVSKKTVTAIVEKSVGEAVGKETEARLEFQSDQEAANEGFSESINTLNNEVFGADGGPSLAQKVENEAAARKQAVEDEAKKRAAADREEAWKREEGDRILASQAEETRKKAEAAKADAAKALADGTSFVDVGASVAYIGRASLSRETTEEPVRGGSMGMGGPSFRLGNDKPDHETALFLDFLLGSDGVAGGPDVAINLGAERMGVFSLPKSVGISITGQVVEDHVNFLDSGSYNRSLIAGVTVLHDLMPGPTRLPVRLGFGLGVNSWGAVTIQDGEEVVVPGFGPTGMVVLSGYLGDGSDN